MLLSIRRSAVLVAAAAVLAGTAVGVPASAAAPPSEYLSSTVNGQTSQTPYITQTAVVQAHLSSSLNGTPYFVRLYDTTNNTAVGGDCLSGSLCTWNIRFNAAGAHNYDAHLDTGKGGPPPYHTVGHAYTSVTWSVPPVTLTAQQFGGYVGTVGDGTTVQIIAGLPISLNGSGLFLRITDTADNSIVGSDCTTGMNCAAYVAYAESTKIYSAHLDNAAHNVLTTSPPAAVSWTGTGWRVGINAYDNEVEATVNGDITDTPYYLYVMNANTKAIIGSPCGVGTTCDVTGGVRSFDVAFLATGYSTSPSFPPANTFASSDTQYNAPEVIH